MTNTVDAQDQKSPENKKALGRGLAALLGGGSSIKTQVEGEAKTPPSTESKNFSQLALAKISPNPEQPRKYFNETKLNELAQSLKEQGLVQPIVVRRLPGPEDKYQIVAGERRYRAAKIAGLMNIPAFIRDKDISENDNDLASLVENIQREELNPIELAESYDRLLKTNQFTQETLAKKLGVSRVSIANSVRLIKLPLSVKELIIKKLLSEGHARVLVSLPNEESILKIAQLIVSNSLSVRDAESEVRRELVELQNLEQKNTQQNEKSLETSAEAPKDGLPTQTIKSVSFVSSGSKKAPELLSIEEEFRELFGTKVLLRGNLDRGAVEIFYSNKDALHRIVHHVRAIKGQNK